MKHYRLTIALAFGILLLQGCVAFPPLIQVQHKHDAPTAPASNDEVLRRLDSIDKRLNELEKNEAR